MLQIESVGSEAVLEFSEHSGDYFPVTLRSSTHFATREVYAYTDANGIARLFNEAAEQWRGWKDAKRWESLEGELSLELTSDKTGHIDLLVEIDHDIGNPDPWHLKAALKLEAGQLEQIAVKVRSYFS